MRSLLAVGVLFGVTVPLFADEPPTVKQERAALKEQLAALNQKLAVLNARIAYLDALDALGVQYAPPGPGSFASTPPAPPKEIVNIAPAAGQLSRFGIQTAWSGPAGSTSTATYSMASMGWQRVGRFGFRRIGRMSSGSYSAGGYSMGMSAGS